MKWTKPDRARVTYYNAGGKTIESREYPVKGTATCPVVDTGTPPAGAAYQRSQGIYVIDPLAAETDAQRTERRDAESAGRQVLNAVLTTIGLTVAGLVLMGAGIYIGATNPDTWTQLPFTPEPSGERAEPEEGAR